MRIWIALIIGISGAPAWAAQGEQIRCPTDLGSGWSRLQVCHKGGSLLLVDRLGDFADEIVAVVPAETDRGSVTGSIREIYGNRIPAGSPIVKTIDEFAPAGQKKGLLTGIVTDDPDDVRKTLLELLSSKDGAPAAYQSVVFRYINAPRRGPRF